MFMGNEKQLQNKIVTTDTTGRRLSVV